MTGPGT